MNTEHDHSDPYSLLFKESDETETQAPTSEESLLYPELPKDYFSDKEDALVKPKSGLASIVERYENAKVKPYFKAVDLNNDRDNPGENRPKMAYEIGVKFTF